MTYTKSQTVNVVKGKNVKQPYTHDTSELEKAYISIQDTHETASGFVNLQYENCTVRVKYDTVVGPDGLLTTIQKDVDDLVKAKIFNDYVYIRITEDMVNVANDVLTKHKPGVIHGEDNNVILATNL